MCHLDYTMSEAGGVTNFVRQYILASGGPYCDCGFACVSVDVGGYGIIWGDDLDLSCDELLEHGEQVATPFDGLLSFGDASELWGLEVRILPVAPRAVPYGVLLFLFCTDFMGSKREDSNSPCPRFVSRGAETHQWGVFRARLGESSRSHQTMKIRTFSR